MIAVDPAVKALLDGQPNTIWRADLYTFNLLNGQVLRYTTADQDVTWAGNTWLGSALRVERGKISLGTGVEVDDLEIDCYPGPSDVIGANLFAGLAVSGGLDGCYVQYDLAVGSVQTPYQPFSITGIVPKRFYGRGAQVKGGRSKITITVKSDLDLLNLQMPRVMFQPPCSHSLYDGGCTLSKAAFTATGKVTAAAAPGLNGFTTNLTAGDQYFNLGVVSFTGGANDGQTRTLTSYLSANGALTFLLPLPQAPQVGDPFIIYPGCDKTSLTCANKFGNLQNFRGFPFVPNPETAFL